MDGKKINKQEYKPTEIEKKWQKVWLEEKIYQPDLDEAKRPFYNLMMFPYPSAEGLHAGNMYAFTGADIFGRYQRMKGFDVFEPIGLDGFGIHTENFALSVKKHPMELIKESEKNFYKQLKDIGNGYDWSRTVETYDPNYYKWTQWIFIQMFKKGLAIRKKAPVNFCPSCETVLADEQVIGGRCERCETEVVKKELEQWFFKITDYAERLLNSIPKLNWSEKIKIAQTNWIGRSEGMEIEFEVKDSKEKIPVFTTRPDTLYGATFLVISPEHPFVASLLKSKIKNQKSKIEIEKYVEKAQKKSERERLAEDKEKTGIFSGFYALNPVNNQQLPIWIADYVLMGYGTGAIMAVPAHDQRDLEFAKKYSIPLIQVIKPKFSKSVVLGLSVKKGFQEELIKNKIQYDVSLSSNNREHIRVTLADSQVDRYVNVVKKYMKEGWWVEIIGSRNVYLFHDRVVENFFSKQEEIFKECKKLEPLVRKFSNIWEMLDHNAFYNGFICNSGDGILVNSEKWNGWQIPNEIAKVYTWLEERGIGKREVHYHLRDWLISRQRYWGPPIPMIFCEKCGWNPVSEEDLPLKLPYIKNYRPLGAGKAPLATHPEFYGTTCPKCKGEAMRETDVSDTFLDSAWYFFRYISTEFEKEIFSKERVKKWLPVDMYIGGAEHAVLHLLYSRFMTMFFKDIGLIDFEEPYKRFFAHGLLIKEGAKMSKSKGNIIVPDTYINKYGADTMRCYLMFLGQFSQGGDFYDSGIEGINRFLNRVWKLRENLEVTEKEEDKDTLKMIHKTIKGVTNDVERLSYNTAIAKLMEFYNFIADKKEIGKDTLVDYLKLIAPFAPFISEEIYQQLTAEIFNLQSLNSTAKFSSIHVQPWPKFDPNLIKEKEITIVVQVNGKVRDTIKVPVDKKKEEIEEMAKKGRAKSFLEGKDIRNVVYVEGKIINFVID